MFFITENTIPAQKVEAHHSPTWPAARAGLVPFSDLLLAVVSLGLGDELLLDDGRFLEGRTCGRHGCCGNERAQAIASYARC